MAKKAKYVSSNERVKDILKDFQNLGYSHGISTVFTDYITLISCAVSNRVDKVHFEERENLYLNTIKKYNEEERLKIVEIHNKVINTLEQTLYEKDLLGEIYHALNLSNSWNGQFFTPIHIAHLMASITIGTSIDEIKSKGHFTLQEPTCGSGVMVIAAADVLYKNKLNPSQDMCVLAIDNDIRCAMMTYIQLSYLGIPAVVVHGDSLRIEEYTRFYTPVYMLGGWLWREPLGMTEKISDDDLKLREMEQPIITLMKSILNEEEEKENGQV